MKRLGDGYGGSKFSILAQYVEPINRYTWRVLLPACSITNEEPGNNDSEGGKGVTMKVSFNITKPVQINRLSILKYRIGGAGPIVRATAAATLGLQLAV